MINDQCTMYNIHGASDMIQIRVSENLLMKRRRQSLIPDTTAYYKTFNIIN